MALIALVAVGAIAWKTRKLQLARRDEGRRKSMHPRRLAPPSAPGVAAEDEEIFP